MIKTMAAPARASWILLIIQSPVRWATVAMNGEDDLRTVIKKIGSQNESGWRRPNYFAGQGIPGTHSVIVLAPGLADHNLDLSYNRDRRHV